jgi:nucleoside-diphosphate-sugar epimerase
VKIVLGGAGFIGYNLSKALLKSGQEVLVIDNLDTTLYSADIKRIRVRKLRDLGAAVRTNNEVQNWGEILSHAETVFNLAATAGLSPSWSKFDAYIVNNVGFLHFLLSQLQGLKKQPLIVHASTSSVYGSKALGYGNQLLEPSSPYGVTKLAAENLLRSFADAFGTRHHILRLFSVYGPHQRPDQFFSIVLNALRGNKEITIYGDGTNIRTNVFVEDVVRAFIAASNLDSAPITVDISGLQKITVMDIIARFSKLSGIEPRINFANTRKGDQTSTEGNLEFTRQILDWEPEVDFSAGTLALFEHFSRSPELYGAAN